MNTFRKVTTKITFKKWNYVDTYFKNFKQSINMVKNIQKFKFTDTFIVNHLERNEVHTLIFFISTSLIGNIACVYIGLSYINTYPKYIRDSFHVPVF